MVIIESTLNKLQGSDDLSYSQVATQSDQEIAAQINSGKKLIDQTTLERLIDECKQEQDQIDSISQKNFTDGQSVVSRQSELSMMQLSKVDRQERTIQEAQTMLE